MPSSPAESRPDASENVAPSPDHAPTEVFPWLLGPAQPAPAMGLLAGLHGSLVFNRRTQVLSECFAQMLPADTKVLDVGCGDGLIDHLITQRRPDVTISGVDLIVRPRTHIPVTAFDGKRIPFEDGAFDIVMFVDVLHHTEDPAILLAEARRVARRAVVLKDHTRDGHPRRARPSVHGLGRQRAARHPPAVQLLAGTALARRLRAARLDSGDLAEQAGTLPDTGHLVFRPFPAFRRPAR